VSFFDCSVLLILLPLKRCQFALIFFEKQIEGFLAYCLELNKVYLVWVKEVTGAKLFMRCQETKNNQKRMICYTYELDKESILSIIKKR